MLLFSFIFHIFLNNNIIWIYFNWSFELTYLAFNFHISNHLNILFLSFLFAILFSFMLTMQFKFFFFFYFSECCCPICLNSQVFSFAKRDRQLYDGQQLKVLLVYGSWAVVLYNHCWFHSKMSNCVMHGELLLWKTALVVAADPSFSLLSSLLVLLPFLTSQCLQ